MNFLVVRVKTRSTLLPEPFVFLKEGFYLIRADEYELVYDDYKDKIREVQVCEDFSMESDDFIDISETKCPKCGHLMYEIGGGRVCPYCDEHAQLYRAIFSLKAYILLLNDTLKRSSRLKELDFVVEQMVQFESRYLNDNALIFKELLKPIASLKNRVEKLEKSIKNMNRKINQAQKDMYSVKEAPKYGKTRRYS